MKNAVTLILCLSLLAGISVAASRPDAAAVSRLEAIGCYREVLELCAEAGESAAAMCIQGDYYYHGRKDVPRDKSRGQERYRRALGLLLPDAEAGDATAQYQTALCHEYGIEDMKGARE